MLTLPQFRANSTTQRHCPVCEARRAHRVVWQKWGYPILRCLQCGLGSTDADGFDPNSYYTAEYFQGGKRDGYGDYCSSEAVLKAEFRGVVRILQGYGCAGRILEVGSAYGFFLETAREAGLDALGLEICDDAVASCQARGLNAHAGIITRDFLRQHGPFDAIVMLDVIEHLPEPDNTMALLASALNQSGLLVLTTGNWSSLLSTITRSRWRLMTPPQHLFYYTRSTLKKLANNHGLNVIRVNAPWKRVPLGLMAYQVTRRIGLPLTLPAWLNRIGIPVNLFDALRLIARKEMR